MLTRLQVKGFKNLLDVDVRFGPFTCIAGCNGVGKSNLFDAICFLGSLARVHVLEAVLSIRGERGRTGDIRHIFHHHGKDFDPEMEFIADMIVPKEAIDDLGQLATASYTFLRYTLKLLYKNQDNQDKSQNPIQILFEELTYLPKGEIKDNLLFKFSKTWRDDAITGRKTTKFISTEENEGKTIIKLHQDQKRGGKTQSRLASTLPRTVLSSINAGENPTALCARREMESWKLLQLEPSALRKPDDYTAPSFLANNGEHLPSTLHRLAQKNPEKTYQTVANSLSELIDDVRGVRIDADEKRQLYTLFVKDSNGTEHPAHSLSDGTLRFLALTVLGMDPQAQGLICVEEPENGIHPERIPAMLELLKGMAVDTEYLVGDDNPLRQIIVNTHSPGFVAEVPADTLLAVENKEVYYKKRLDKGIIISAMGNTWRSKNPLSQRMTKKILLSYLQPFSQPQSNPPQIVDKGDRVIDQYENAVQMSFKNDLLCVAEPRVNYEKD
jgi:predicted ATPase